MFLRNIVVTKIISAKISFIFVGENGNFYLVKNSLDASSNVPSCFDSLALLFFDGSYVNTRGDKYLHLRDALTARTYSLLVHNILTIRSLRETICRDLVALPITYITLTNDTSEKLDAVVKGRGYIYISITRCVRQLTLNVYTTGQWPSRYAENEIDFKNYIRETISNGDRIVYFSMSHIEV